MKVMRIFTGTDGRACVEYREVPLDAHAERPVSADVPVARMFFRETPAGHVHGKHRAPQRQFIFVTSGVGEIELDDGTTWRFQPGDVTFAEDTTGEGHITRTLQGPRGFVHVPVADSFDITRWPLADTVADTH